MKKLIIITTIMLAITTYANDKVYLTPGGSYTTATGTMITCTSSNSDKGVTCFCNRYGELFISKGKITSYWSLNKYRDEAECLKMVVLRADCK